VLCCARDLEGGQALLAPGRHQVDIVDPGKVRRCSDVGNQASGRSCVGDQSRGPSSFRNGNGGAGGTNGNGRLAYAMVEYFALSFRAPRLFRNSRHCRPVQRMELMTPMVKNSGTSDAAIQKKRMRSLVHTKSSTPDRIAGRESCAAPHSSRATRVHVKRSFAT